jgi:hypothetical protein
MKLNLSQYQLDLLKNGSCVEIERDGIIITVEKNRYNAEYTVTVFNPYYYSDNTWRSEPHF